MHAKDVAVIAKLSFKSISAPSDSKLVSLYVGGDETDANGVAHEAGNVVNIERFHQLRAMHFNRFYTELQLLRDLFGTVSLREQLQDFALSQC